MLDEMQRLCNTGDLHKADQQRLCEFFDAEPQTEQIAIVEGIAAGAELPDAVHSLFGNNGQAISDFRTRCAHLVPHIKKEALKEEAVKELLLGSQKASYEHLRDRMPELQKLESQKAFETFEFMGRSSFTDVDVFRFDVKAPSLFPDTEQRVIDSGIATKESITRTSSLREGEGDEIFTLAIGFHDYRIQIELNFRK